MSTAFRFTEPLPPALLTEQMPPCNAQRFRAVRTLACRSPARTVRRPALPGARLALPAAVAPYRITAEDVAAWRRPEHTDHCLVHLVAYGAFLAVDRVESALQHPTART